MARKIYPPHGKVFERPIRLTREGRKQVGATKEIKAYVGGFRARGLKGLKLAQAIIKDVLSFRKVALNSTEAKANWARRSAEEIIKSRTVYLNKGLVMVGCTDRAIAMAASLRAAGFRVAFVRADCHTYLKLWQNNKLWIVNTLPTQTYGIREISEKDKKHENDRWAANAIGEGPSLAQIGIKGHREFFKFRDRSGKKKH
ncbi:MAG: hypothetical protein JW744_00030 [Candidatus Diapherotrites archaeon]|uniref:Uncharacterized protein n=1 Tax=Candidatus Iainarchaeum sp. TaxID=3101447 RepID=A0A938YTF6_9ARCH|nr:hypothetical protein [Candidatus Diapherotrites archaeon]